MNDRMFKTNKTSLPGVILTIFVSFFMLIHLLPFVILVINAFKPEEDIFNIHAKVDFSYLDNFKMIFAQPGFLQSVAFTIIICAITLAGAIFSSSLSGYIVARANKGLIKKAYWVFVLMMIVPYQTGMIILYDLGVKTGMINTVPFLILVYLGGNVAYSSLIYFAFTKTIPREMEESATIDGCGKFTTFYRIIFPLLLPATGTIIVTQVFWYWNDLQGPLIYLGAGLGDAPQTMIMYIYNFRLVLTGQYSSTLWGPTSAVCLLACIPMIVFFLCTQRYLIRGLVVGAVKG